MIRVSVEHYKYRKQEEKTFNLKEEMKRKREIMAKETEIKSAIQELSLINKLINNGNGDSSSPSSVVAATVVVAAVSEQQRRVLSYIPTSSFLSLCTLIVQVLGT